MDIDTEVQSNNASDGRLAMEMKELLEKHQTIIQEKSGMQREFTDVQAKHAKLQSDYSQLQDLVKTIVAEKEWLRKERDKLDKRLAKRKKRPATADSESPRDERAASPLLLPMSIEATSVPMLEDAPTEDLSLGAFPPATIEPPDTSLVEVTPVEGLRSHTDSQSPRQWEDGAGRYDEFELFVCAGNNPDGRLIGRSFFITEEASTGIAMVGQVIEEAKTHFAELQLSAFNLLGKRLPNLEPSYVFNALSAQQRTIFLAPEDVAARYIMAAPYLAVQPSSTGASSVLTMANTSIGHPRRRKRSVDQTCYQSGNSVQTD
jgi:FtsZ-binding cell division protein ZapB